MYRPDGKYHGTVTVPGNLRKAIYEFYDENPSKPLTVPDFPSSDAVCTSKAMHIAAGLHRRQLVG
jgi:hypothetical protein